MCDDEKHWGPFTWGSWHRCFSIEWSSGGGEEQDPRNYLRITGFGKAFRVWLPRILRPWREDRQSSINPADTFTTYWPREYGFSLTRSGGVASSSYDFLIFSLGAQTHDSSTTKNWSCFLPWTNWDMVRHSLYAPDGSHFYTEPRFKRGNRPKGFDYYVWKVRETAPASYFAFEDYDGKHLIATCHIEEREWRIGYGFWKILRLFNKPLVHRDLNLEFDHEMGPEKGSWKGGTTGHSCEMRPEDFPINAFKRYCEEEHSARGNRKYRIKFIGPCGPPEPRDIRVARNRGWKQTSNPAVWYNNSVEIPGRFTTEQMLAHIKDEQDANNAQMAGMIKSS